MTRTAADVEREVEASRGELDRTVEALKDKMTPGQIFDEATRAMGGAGHQVMSKFVEQAKANPMPLAVMGLGLAWLMMSNRQSSGAQAYAGYEARSFEPASSGGGSHPIGDRMHAAGDKASELVSGAKDRLTGRTSQAADSSRRAMQNLGDMAGVAADRAVQYGRTAQRSVAGVIEDEPLLVGAVGLLVGAAIGAALPSTRTEDRLVGPLRDDLVEKGKEMAQAGMQQAGDVAQAAYGTLKSELQQSGDAPPADRAEDAVRAAVQAGKSQVQGQPPN